MNSTEDFEGSMNPKKLCLESIEYEGNRDGIIIIQNYILYLLIHTKKTCDICVFVFQKSLHQLRLIKKKIYIKIKSVS